MNNKKLNILTPIPFWHPGTQELIDGLKQNGYSVVSLDIWSFNYYNEKQEIVNLVPKLFRGKLEGIYKRLFRNHIIRKYIKKDQVVDIQWCGHFYSKYINEIKHNSKKVFATLFGSDFYRSSSDEHKIQRKIFEVADKIVMGVNMTSDFNRCFPGFESKFLYAQFGSKRLDLIDEFAANIDLVSLRKKYNIPLEKITLTVGYNSKPIQQHIKFLDIIKNFDKSIKNKLFLIFPLTYGVSIDDDYFKLLISEIKLSGIDYLIFDTRLDDLEIMETKFISDITINLQTTDAMSSSIKEAFASNNIVLVGKWLPYEIFEDKGIFFLRRNIDQFSESILDIISNFSDYQEKCKGNKEKIMSFASWKYLLKQFDHNYEQE
jgi:glycosyltransferase involved in cell wall biosynthesis